MTHRILIQVGLLQYVVQVVWLKSQLYRRILTFLREEQIYQTGSSFLACFSSSQQQNAILPYFDRQRKRHRLTKWVDGTHKWHGRFNEMSRWNWHVTWKKVPQKQQTQEHTQSSCRFTYSLWIRMIELIITPCIEYILKIQTNCLNLPMWSSEVLLSSEDALAYLIKE